MKKIYRPFHQLPYCCVPATLQWILYRRGLDILDQENIGVALGLRLPERFRYLLNNKDVKVMPDDSQEFGTQILKEKYSINNFFDQYKIPLKISEEFKFENAAELEEFILNNIETDRDIILRFNNFIYKGEKGVGHFGLITDYDKESKNIILGDSEPAFFKTITIDQVMESISDKHDNIRRGLYLVDENFS